MVNLLTLLDDIATTLDDVAVMSKVAMKKTSALMSDDLAVNAGVVTGVDASRELPIVKKIFWGSLINKVYAIGGVLALGALYPPIITWVMFLGGLYLSYEGVHKIVEKVSHRKKEKDVALKNKVPEADRVKGAVRTDLVLSIEIIVIAKDSLSGDFLAQLLTLTTVGIAASIIIYGLVAIVVKVDDLGLWLINKGREKAGMIFVRAMPYIMRGLGILGTAAMLLVGGGIMVHTFHLPILINEHLDNLVIGSITGAICLGLMSLKSLFKQDTKEA